MGHEDAHDAEDLQNSRAIVLWGKNVSETGVHLIPHLKAARARGVPIIQIDPVHNAQTLKLSDRHYAPAPGATVSSRSASPASSSTRGGRTPTPPRGATTSRSSPRSSGVTPRRSGPRFQNMSVEDVRAIAEHYGRNKPAALFVGWGLARRIHGSATVRLLDALGALTGNLGVPGGGVSYYFKRRGGFDTGFLRLPENAGARTFLEPILGEELLRADPRIRVAILDNGNPVSQLPDSKKVAAGLSSVDFLVVLDPFLTDTAELAHVVLPTTTMLEEHDVVGAYGHHYIQLSQPVVPPPEGVRSDLAIYQALAERLGFGEAMKGSAESWIERFLAPMAGQGVTREALLRGGLRKPDAPRVLYQDRRFPTPTGRFQLITDFATEPPALEGGYPLHLLSISTYRNQSSQISRAAQQETPSITLHPDAAAGHEDGSLARLVSPIGEVTVRLRFDPKQRRDVVVYSKGRWGKLGGPNSLIRARVTDAGGGAAYYDQGVRIEPATPALD